MASGRDRAFYSGKHKRHGVNVQVLADPAGRLVWASPALPGARRNMGAYAVAVSAKLGIGW
jgi:DDE superfamily endonuclease